MFKKTVVMMALVMMATQAFAATDLRTEADAKRAEDAKVTREHVADQRAEDVKDAALKSDVSDMTIEMRANPKLADGVTKTLEKASHMMLNIKGKAVSVRDLISRLSAKMRSMRSAGKLKPGSQLEKDMETEVEFVAFGVRVNEAGGKAEAAVQREMSLTPEIADWTGAAHDSHIALERETLQTEQSGNLKQDDAFDKVIAKKFGDKNKTEKEDEIAGCE